MIHVIDDSKKEKRDFTFSRSLLVKYMKYFYRCLKKISDNDEIDISIHCDAQIFEWLLNYIFAMEEYEKKQAEQDRLQKNNWQIKVQKCVETEKDEKSSSFANSAIMKYGGPKLDIKNAVTILIPAEFLNIDRLVRECLDFIGEHIEEISRVMVDMSKLRRGFRGCRVSRTLLSSRETNGERAALARARGGHAQALCAFRHDGNGG